MKHLRTVDIEVRRWHVVTSLIRTVYERQDDVAVTEARIESQLLIEQVLPSGMNQTT